MTTITNEALRPDTFEGFIGQEKLKARLRPYINEALETQAPMAHVLLTSQPGCGKTTLAELIAKEVGDPFQKIDLARMTDNQFISFMRRFEGGILFIDEVHRAKARQQEALLTVMEEGYASTSYGGRLEIPWICVVSATTEKHKILPAVAERFPLRLELDPYSDDDMTEIVYQMAISAEIDPTDDDVKALGIAAGGVPRAARDLVRAWRALSFDDNASVENALDLVGREADGLTAMHLEYLRTLDRLEGSAGAASLANHLQVHPSELQSLERLLVARGLIALPSTGRAITQKGDRRVRGESPTIVRRVRT